MAVQPFFNREFVPQAAQMESQMRNRIRDFSDMNRRFMLRCRKGRGMEVRLKKICRLASVLAILMFNTGCALYLSSYYYDSINKMKYICTPSCMDIIVSCMNEYNIQIIAGTVILLNMYGILGQHDKNVFLLKFGSVKKYKRYINRKIIIQSLFYSTYFFANVLFFATRSGYVMLNWSIRDSYFCFVNYAVSDIRLWTCLLAVYLSLLLNWLLTSEIFF